MSLRIYAIKPIASDGRTVMVKAANQAQALRHVARHTYRVSVASAVDVADHMADGWKIEDATRDEPQADILEGATK